MYIFSLVKLYLAIGIHNLKRLTENHFYPAKLIYLNFQPLEVVFRYRYPQLQVAENYLHLLNLSTYICKS